MRSSTLVTGVLSGMGQTAHVPAVVISIIFLESFDKQSAAPCHHWSQVGWPGIQILIDI